MGDQQSACGRTINEQIEAIKTDGTHAVTSVLRKKLLHSLGIKEPKTEAENVIIFGCYRPFISPELIRQYIKLFEILHIDYTWLDKEYCCGFPVIGRDPEKKPEGEAFNRRNIASADEKNAETLAYCCVGCATAAKHLVQDSPKKLVYALDLILDAMEKYTCRITPVRMGYFEGCHAWFNYNFPNGKQNWPRYRQMLDTIDGLTIVDLPNNLCCKRAANKLFEKADELNLEYIVMPCNDCYQNLLDKADGRFKIVTYPEILLQSLETQ